MKNLSFSYVIHSNNVIPEKAYEVIKIYADILRLNFELPPSDISEQFHFCCASRLIADILILI